jgi:hypothetical protein
MKWSDPSGGLGLCRKKGSRGSRREACDGLVGIAGVTGSFVSVLSIRRPDMVRDLGVLALPQRGLGHMFPAGMK